MWKPYYSITSGKGVGSTQSAPQGFVYKFATTDEGYYGEYESGADANGGNPHYGRASVNSGGQGGSASVSGQGSSAKTEELVVKVTYRWEAKDNHPAGTPVIPPTDSTKGFSIYSSIMGLASGGQESVFTLADGKDSIYSYPTFGMAVAKRLFRIDPISGLEFSGTMPLRAEVNANGSASLLFSFSSSLDNRSASISSPTIEPSYYKGDLPAYPYPHTPKANGDKSADSIVHLVGGPLQATEDGIDLSDKRWETPSTRFNANLVGPWNSPTFAWSSEGDNGPAIGFNSSALYQERRSFAQTAFNMGSDENSFPKSSSVKFTATDADGAVAENTFNIKWHLQYEKSRDLPDGPKHKEIYWVSRESSMSGDVQNVEVVPARVLDVNASINGVLIFIGDLGAPGANELAKIFQIITGVSEFLSSEEEVKLTDYGLGNNKEKFEAVVRETPENISDMTADTTKWRNLSPSELTNTLSLYNCYFARVRIHHEERALADKYDAHGYAGWDNVLRHDVTDESKFETFYQRKTTAPTPPTLGRDSEIPTSYYWS